MKSPDLNPNPNPNLQEMMKALNHLVMTPKVPPNLIEI